MYRLYFSILLVLISASALKAQGLALYLFEDLEQPSFGNKKALFVSLSDSYPLSERSDSQAIPDLENSEIDDLKFFKLDSKYRKRFLSKTKIAETDSVFVYDYSSDILHSIPVKNLDAVASLNIYMRVEMCNPCDQYDYQIGFEIGKNLLTGLGDRNTLVYVGKKNPFARKQMKAIVWEKIDSKDFPLAKSSIKTYRYGEPLDNKSRSSAAHIYTYIYRADNFLYYLQDFGENASDLSRHLLVLDSKSGKVVVERLYGNGEGLSLTPLNTEEWKEQWTGKLFNGKPPVVFGFEYDSFGCPEITFLNKAEKDLFIKCDNRH